MREWTNRQRTHAARLRQRRKLTSAGFQEIDPTRCGFPIFDAIKQRGRRIAAVEISADGSRLFVKLNEAPEPTAR